jgi:NAD(P)-dependent dehydrogenase (short-subunit alcohol dehydrogenase family)
MDSASLRHALSWLRATKSFCTRAPQNTAADLADIASRSAGFVIGDLSSAAETRAIAEQVNKIGRMDAVIHNAGIYLETSRATTREGHAKILAVNTLAPYMLTTLIERPNRLIYLSSSMHRGADGSLRDIDWVERRWDASRAYSESKLYLTALALAVARHWPDVLSNAVDPGWVPTKMGGPGATDDLTMGTSLRRGSPAATIPLRESVVVTGINENNRNRPPKRSIPTSRIGLPPGSPN